MANSELLDDVMIDMITNHRAKNCEFEYIDGPNDEKVLYGCTFHGCYVDDYCGNNNCLHCRGNVR